MDQSPPPVITPEDRKRIQQNLRDFAGVLHAISIASPAFFTDATPEQIPTMKRMASAMYKIYEKRGVIGLANFINRITEYHENPSKDFVFKPYERDIFDIYLEQEQRESDRNIGERHEDKLDEYHQKINRRKAIAIGSFIAGSAAAPFNVGVLGLISRSEKERHAKEQQLAAKSPEGMDGQELRDDIAALHSREQALKWGSLGIAAFSCSATMTAFLTLAMREQRPRREDVKETPEQITQRALIEIDSTLRKASRDAHIDHGEFRHV